MPALGPENYSKFVLVGGISSRSRMQDTTSRCFTYESKNGILKEVGAMSNSRHQFPLVYIQTENNDAFCVMAIGGIQKIDKEVITLKSCAIFDPDLNSWVDAPNLSEPRSNATACQFQGKFVYLFGGFTKN